jgi:hypothetical protein
MSHLSAIGFAMSLDAFQEQVERATPNAIRFDTPRGAYLQWSPDGGIELWMQANAVQKIVGCNPHFRGLGRIEAAIIQTISAPGRPLDGYCVGWASPRDPGNPYSGIHAFAANLPDFAFIDERILMPPIVTLQVAAFASYLECYPTESGFVDSESGQAYGAQMGSSVWVHAERDGLPQPEAFLSGIVVSSERRKNPETGQDFHALLLRTDAGTVDVVADLETSPRRPVFGAIVAGQFWLSARVVNALPPRKPAPFRRARTQTWSLEPT